MEEIRTYKTIPEVLEYKGIPFKVESGGSEFRISCPQCNHKNSKCYINAYGKGYYCFHCGAYGSEKGLLEFLGAKGNVDLEITEKPEPEPDLPPIDSRIIEENHKRLTEGSKCEDVRKYLYNRGLDDEILKKSKLGWDGRNLVIPVLDGNGDCVNFRLRSDPTRPNSKHDLFSIPGRGRHRLFNEAILKSKPKRLIICEGEWDCLLLTKLGYDAITSTGGCDSFRAEWISYFEEIEKIYICFDNDFNQSGQKGAEKTAKLFNEAGIPVFVVKLPDPSGTNKNTDVTDYLTKLAKTKEDFEAILQSAESRKPKASLDDGKPKLADLLVKFSLEEGCELYLDQKGDPHVSLPEKPLIGFPIKSSAFRRWLSGKVYEEVGKGFSETIFNQVVATLEGKAFHDEAKIDLYNRIARVEDKIYYDLGDDKNIVCVSPTGWQIGANYPVRFRRFSHQKTQVIPALGGKLIDIYKYLNLSSEADRLLFLTYLVAVSIPDIPRVIIINIGDQGAAKSTALRVARSLIDPSNVELLTPTEDIAQLSQQANHHYCLYYDNLSHLSEKTPDALSRFVTGIGFAKRKLYTDEDDILFNQKVAVGITGITLVAQKADLLDRSLIINFEVIPEETRIDETEFWKNFASEKAQLLGALFTVLSKTLKIVESLKLGKKPRMADYAKYATAASIALGKTADEFLTAFSENIKRQNQAAIESSPTAQVILQFMADQETWVGASSKLHGELKRLAEDAGLHIGGSDGFPKSSNWLWKKIMQVRPNLRSRGIIITKREIGAGTEIYLRTLSSNIGSNTAITAIEPEASDKTVAAVAVDFKTPVGDVSDVGVESLEATISDNRDDKDNTSPTNSSAKDPYKNVPGYWSTIPKEQWPLWKKVGGDPDE